METLSPEHEPAERNIGMQAELASRKLAERV
jgi:hypothetical protein